MDVTGIGSILDFGGKIIDRLWPDKAQADAAKFELFKLQQSGELQVMQAEAGITMAQIKVNEVEAANANLFVSGWRPAIGWICGLACAWNWVGIGLVDAGLKLSGHQIDLLTADTMEMLPILGGLLGLGTLRTVERIKGVHRA
jgi:hypothetical protein